MSIDILAALADEAPARASSKCKIQRWLDNIDPGTPGFADLVVLIETTDPKDPAFRTGDKALRVVRRLGLDTSMKTFMDHRAERCRCAD